MAGCVSCFIIPLVLFIFHRFIQPLILKFWNPWENKEIENDKSKKNDDILIDQTSGECNTKESCSLLNGDCCTKR